MKKASLVTMLIIAITSATAYLASAQIKNSAVKSENKQVNNATQSSTASSPNSSSPKKMEMIDGFPVVRLDGSLIIPTGFQDMIDRSDLVIIGRPLQSMAESTAVVKRDSEGYISFAVSHTEFKISRVIKGSSPSNTILIGQEAAIVKDKGDSIYVMRVMDEYQPLVKNAKYVLFLKKGLAGSPAYYPFAAYYGKVNLDNRDKSENRLDEIYDTREIRRQAKERYREEIERES